MASKNQEEELKATLSIERNENARNVELLQKRLAELEQKNVSLESQVKIATNGAGVPDELQKDIEWRVACGLRRDQAEDVARRQWAEKIQAESAKAAVEAAKAPQVSPESKGEK